MNFPNYIIRDRQISEKKGISPIEFYCLFPVTWRGWVQEYLRSNLWRVGREKFNIGYEDTNYYGIINEDLVRLGYWKVVNEILIGFLTRIKFDISDFNEKLLAIKFNYYIPPSKHVNKLRKHLRRLNCLEKILTEYKDLSISALEFMVMDEWENWLKIPKRKV